MAKSEHAVEASQIISNLAYAAMVGMVCVVMYRQHKTEIDQQLNEWRWKLSELAQKRPWPTGKMWQDVREAANGDER